MKIQTLARTMLVCLCVAAGTAVVAGCPNAVNPAKVADVKPGPMPTEAKWEGVYYSALFGFLHVVEEGNRVIGRWERPVKDRWGELRGKIDGNLCKFTWIETIYGVITPESRKEGKGYFVYSRPEGENVDDEIAGQVGRGDDEIGVEWKAVKQRNMKPDIGSIGNESSSDVGGGDWDSPNKQKGEPEAPKPPTTVKPPEL